MQVLIVSQYFWPETFRINDLAQDLVVRGHKVSVLTGFPTYPRRDVFDECRPSEDQWCGVRIFRTPLASRGAGQHWRLAANYLSFAVNASVHARLGLRLTDRPDVILAFQPSPATALLPAIVAGRRARAPVVAWLQDLWPETLAAVGAVRSRRVQAAVTPAVTSLYRQCDLVLAHSEDFLPALLARGMSPDQLGYLPAWAEDLYRPVPRDPAVARDIGLPNGFVAMIAGNLGVAQSLETLVDAAELLRNDPSVHWVVVGDGQRRDWLAAEVARRGLGSQVHLIGRHPVEAMPQLFAHADVLVATLRRDPVLAMTLPARVQSYLGCGRPVVAAMDGEGARVVRDAGGLAVPAADAAGLARAVAAMKATRPAQRAATGEAAREYYLKRFERSMLLDQFEARLVTEATKRSRSLSSTFSTSLLTDDGGVVCES